MPACFSFFSGVKNYSTGTPEINKINPPVVWGPVVRNPFLKWAPVSPGKKTAVQEWLLPTREHESTFQPLYLTPVPPPGCSESLGKWLSFQLENNSTYCLPVFQHCKDSGYHLVDLAQRLAHWCAHWWLVLWVGLLHWSVLSLSHDTGWTEETDPSSLWVLLNSSLVYLPCVSLGHTGSSRMLKWDSWPAFAKSVTPFKVSSRNCWEQPGHVSGELWTFLFTLT